MDARSAQPKSPLLVPTRELEKICDSFKILLARGELPTALRFTFEIHGFRHAGPILVGGRMFRHGADIAVAELGARELVGSSTPPKGLPMLIEPPLHPVRYSPSLDEAEPHEAETAKALTEQMRGISETTFKDGGHAIRSVHAKSHGLLHAELEIFPDLSPVLAQGVFAQSGRRPVVMRFSTVPGDILDDSVSTPRGLAIKLLGVDGERLPGSEGDTTQDFVMVNGKTFSAPNAKVFLANLKLLAATTDKVEGVKKAVSAAARGAEHLVEALGGKSPLLASLGGQPVTHILGESFYSQLPIRYGDYIAKVAVVPYSQELSALTDKPVELHGDADGLRHAVMEFFKGHGGAWDIRVQLCADIETMPIENASKAWDEDESPYVTVGRITAAPQLAWSEGRSDKVDDGMSFSPWHGIAAHQPLGSIMRMRKMAYEMSARFRESHNNHPVEEPRSFSPMDS